MTTAAGLWLAGAVGLACGLSLWTLGAVAAFFGFGVITLLGWITHNFGPKKDE